MHLGPFLIHFKAYVGHIFAFSTLQNPLFFLQGIRGFWKGVTASYWGISETMIHFLIYEYLKKKLAEAQNKRKTDDKTFLDFAGFMLCGACSKTCATIVAYPHGKTFITFTVTLKQTFEHSFRYFEFVPRILIFTQQSKGGKNRNETKKICEMIQKTL